MAADRHIAALHGARWRESRHRRRRLDKRKSVNDPDTNPTVILTAPDAPWPTTATTMLSFNTWKEAAGTPPKLTPAAPVK